MNNYWVSFSINDASCSAFEYHGPWWESGYGDGYRNLCAAVQAEDESEAESIIHRCFDEGHTFREWRFCSTRPSDWNPLEMPGGRFVARDWMKWPPSSKATGGERG